MIRKLRVILKAHKTAKLLKERGLSDDAILRYIRLAKISWRQT